MRFDFFKIHYEMPETSVSGRDSQTMSVNFHALFDLNDRDSMMKITWATDDSGITADFDA